MGLFPWQRDDPDGPGLGPALFAILLLVGMVGGLVGAVVSLAALLTDGAHQRALVAQGVLPEGARVEAWIDTSDAQDASAGCALADGALVRWEDGARVAMIDLADTDPVHAGDDLTVRAAGGEVACPIGRDPAAAAFAALVALRAQDPRSPPPPRAPTDPRLRRHFGLDP